MDEAPGRAVTDEQAADVLAAVLERFGAHLREGGAAPELVLDWDWSGRAVPTVLWEAGPVRWAVRAVGGGPDDDDVPHQPIRPYAGVECEPFTGWALCVYPRPRPAGGASPVVTAT